MDEDAPDKDVYSGYDSPRIGPSRRAVGCGGNLPACSGNSGGGGDPGDTNY